MEIIKWNWTTDWCEVHDILGHIWFFSGPEIDFNCWGFLYFFQSKHNLTHSKLLTVLPYCIDDRYTRVCLRRYATISCCKAFYNMKHVCSGINIASHNNAIWLTNCFKGLHWKIMVNDKWHVLLSIPYSCTYICMYK